jgi:RNA polymerase sigma-70 factor (ECF subfamily)
MLVVSSQSEERECRFEVVAAEVYEPLQRYLRRRASFDDADDVLGDVMLTVWRRLDDIPNDAVLPWCYGIARRLLANKRRGNVRHLKLMAKAAAMEPAPISGDPMEHDEFPHLVSALATLSESDRELLILWAWEELEPREIAVVLDTSANAVSLKLGRAKKKLADEIERQNGRGGGHGADEHTQEHRP